MSKKELLTESEMRRFMRLANIPALGKNLVSEMSDKDGNRAEMGISARQGETTSEAMDPMAGAGADMPPALPAGDMGGDMEGGETLEVGSDADPEKVAALKDLVSALQKLSGLELDVESGDEGGEEMSDLEMGGEDEGGEEEGEEDEGGEEESDEDEMQETQEIQEEQEEEEELEEKMDNKKLSEDELVETVLQRVTARLVAEAKKKNGVKAKMKKKAMEKAKGNEKPKKEKMEEATEAKGGGPLLKQGKNNHNTWKGVPDMEMTKGEKGGKGGHEMETVSAKAEHTVTHGSTNLATKGGNKKK